MKRNINIAIDGPAGSGKTTVGKLLAEKLKFNFLDTGLMYRSFTYFCIKENVNLNNDLEIKNILNEFNLKFIDKIWYINNKKINYSDLFKQNIVKNINKLTKINFVREKMVILQKKITTNGSYILVGRDIGTVVLPNAALKIFLTANVNVRAKRRFEEVKHQRNITFDEVLDDLIFRDKNDTERKFSPLKKAKDAILLDNSNLDIEGSVKEIINIINKKKVIDNE